MPRSDGEAFIEDPLSFPLCVRVSEAYHRGRSICTWKIMRFPARRIFLPPWPYGRGRLRELPVGYGDARIKFMIVMHKKSVIGFAPLKP